MMLKQFRVQALACVVNRQPKVYHPTRAAAFPELNLNLRVQCRHNVFVKPDVGARSYNSNRRL